MDEAAYAPTAFYFSLVVGGSSSPDSGATEVDASFQEITGLQSKIKIEDVPEGGENRFALRLPGRVSYPNLVMKRGLITEDSFLATWFADTLTSNYVNPIETQTLKISLLNKDGQPRISWTVSKAYPVSWQLSTLHSAKNELAIETLELAYEYFYRT